MSCKGSDNTPPEEGGGARVVADIKVGLSVFFVDGCELVACEGGGYEHKEKFLTVGNVIEEQGT